MALDCDFPAFTPMAHSSAKDKEHFCEQFIRFVSKGYRDTMFPKWFYTRLSMTFGFIAHYNQAGFFEEYFMTALDKHRFIDQCLRWPCYGDPAYTYSDVERYLQGWLQENYAEIMEAL